MITWPDGYKIEQTAFHVSRSLEIPSPPEAVWPWLVRAQLWPSWYPEFKDVSIEGGGDELSLGAGFRWRAFGVALRSEVREFVPPERLAWTARARGIDAYHAWLLERLPSGCHVLSEENQKGWLARLNNFLRPWSVAKIHHDWLERLAERAANRHP